MKQHNAIATSILLLAAATHSLAAKEEIQTNSTTMTYGDSASWLTNRFGIGAQLGVQGAGLHLRYDVSEKFNLRLEGNYFKYDDTFEVEDIDYSGEFDFSNVGLLANWLPITGSGFRITGGAFAGALQLDGSASSVGTTIDINGTEYDLKAGDRLDAGIEYNDVTPYLGLGWDFCFGSDKSWVLGIDLGVLYMGEPDVSLVGAGALADPAATADIDAELDSIREDVEDYTFLPVVKIGLTYRF